MNRLPQGSAIRGRDRELSVLADLVADARASSRALAIEGEPGTGKTTLLGAAIDAAESDGYLVLTATGIEAESELPFAGLHQLLLPVLDLVDRLPARQRTALRAAFGMGDEQSPERFLIGLAVLNLLSEVAED